MKAKQEVIRKLDIISINATASCAKHIFYKVISFHERDATAYLLSLILANIYH